jgi:hypothetical protein
VSNGESQAGTIETRVPSRLDRLPWPRFHWMVIIGLSSARTMGVSGPHPPVPLDSEISIIETALREQGSANRQELSQRVGARYWGPGRFREALGEAVSRGRAKRLPGGEFAPAGGSREEAGGQTTE